jgi:hypothetical protein
MNVTDNIIHVIAICGLSLYNMIISERKLYFTNKKLPLVKKEMKRRKLELYIENGNIWKTAATSLPNIIFGIPD